MNWYFNNQGAAEGPFDEADMRAQVKKGMINPRTLVWQVSMETWQEAGPLNPPWWQTAPAKAKPVVRPKTPPASPPPATGPLSGELRRPIPHAPTGSEKPSKMGDLFSKLFGRGGKKKG